MNPNIFGAELDAWRSPEKYPDQIRGAGEPDECSEAHEKIDELLELQ